MATSKVRKPYTVIPSGNVRVPVYRRQQVKNGKAYTGFLVPDHTTGKRKLWFFAAPEDAKGKAKEIADAVAAGRSEILQWEDSLRAELRMALRAVEPSGIKILPACQMFADAVKILGSADQLLLAAQHWKLNGPTKPLTPKPTKEAVT